MAVTVAAAQIEPIIADPEANLRIVRGALEEAAHHGAEFVVLPECALTGYVYGSLDEAMDVAEEVPGSRSDALGDLTRALGIHAVVGTLEREGNRLYNTALLLGPNGLIARYRKTHILCLGVDRFVTPGDIPFAVHDTPVGSIGILICYDLRFPEPARALTLLGAEIIVLPTNWPVGADIQPDVLTRARAAENHVFIVAADRVGQERGGGFIGRSQIVAPFGTVLTEASSDRSEIITASIDPRIAANKHIVLRPGEYEMNYAEDRRPHLYGAITGMEQRV